VHSQVKESVPASQPGAKSSGIRLVEDGQSRNDADDCSEISAENKVETPVKAVEPRKTGSAKKPSAHHSPMKPSAKKSKSGSGQKGAKDLDEANNLQVMHRNLLALLSSSANLADDEIIESVPEPAPA